MTRCVALALAVALITACGGGEGGRTELDSAGARPAPGATVAGGALADGCPRTGHWSECQVRRRLEQSGLAPREAKDEVEGLPELEVKPATLMIGSANAAMYFFADTIARRRAAASLDTLKFIPQTKPLGIRQEATVIQSDNAMLLLFSRNEHQRERVSDAITAGPPQP